MSNNVKNSNFQFGKCKISIFKVLKIANSIEFSQFWSCSLDDLGVEVWDNNMILQLSMPKSGCSVYQVGTDEYDLSDSMALPRLEMAKEKFKLKVRKRDLKELIHRASELEFGKKYNLREVALFTFYNHQRLKSRFLEIFLME